MIETDASCSFPVEESKPPLSQNGAEQGSLSHKNLRRILCSNGGTDRGLPEEYYELCRHINDARIQMEAVPYEPLSRRKNAALCPRSGAETDDHRWLKWQALNWLRATFHGEPQYEVQVGNMRVDVADLGHGVVAECGGSAARKIQELLWEGVIVYVFPYEIPNTVFKFSPTEKFPEIVDEINARLRTVMQRIWSAHKPLDTLPRA